MSGVSFVKAAVNPGAPGHMLASAPDDDEVDSEHGGRVGCLIDDYEVKVQWRCAA